MEDFCLDWVTAVGRELADLTLEECKAVLDDIRSGDPDYEEVDVEWALDESVTPADLLCCALETLEKYVDMDDEDDIEMAGKIERRLKELEDIA